SIMLALHDQEIYKTRKISIRYDNSTRIYYLFYHRIDILSSTLILSYDLNQNKWTIDTIEYNYIFKNYLNDLFNENNNISFEEQIQYIINYLDSYFLNQLQEQMIKINMNDYNIYSLSWFRRLRGIRRWVSQNILTEQSAILQRYSAPE
ncbi:unnamed protein product, partial [Rotaria sp. Silwood1]